MDDIRYRSMTYGQLEFLMSEMGYRKFAFNEPGWNVWTNKQFDALQLLPADKESQLARPHHFMTARKVSIEKGILEPEEFEALLQKAQQHNAEFAHNQDAA